MSKQNVPNDASTDTYDSHIIPAETAARKEREGENYKQHAEFTTEEQQAGEIDTDAGYTVDKEGLVNNYAIEPEMYYEVPGDLKAEEQALAAERSGELEEINQIDETGKLTTEGDKRGKGTGAI
jgi:hypothetical protein